MTKKWIALICTFLLLLLLSGCKTVRPDSGQADFPVLNAAEDENLSLPDGFFRVVFLDVGQGDCTLIISGEEAMLVDCGDTDTFVHVEEVLDRYGIERLRFFVATHDHSDHVGAAEKLIGTVRIDEIYHSALQISDEHSDYGAMFSAAQEKQIPSKAVSAGETFRLGESEVRVVAPSEYDADRVNNSSVVLKISSGEFSVLIAADAERESEHEMCLLDEDLSADLLRVGHHGSASSTSYRFIRRVMPEYAVISVGAGNAYGHPSPAVLSRLSDCAATVYRTDVHGDIVFTVREDGLTVFAQTGEASFLPKQAVPTEEIYIGNRKSKIFHAPDCRNLPAETNRVFFSSAQEALLEGYSPCRGCNP
ncbi:MAG: MBL fold metallo-hydrolase [Clostridia bacterium]|nr:MBL fold metallo-hydrolase [Clostridia bacterium]